MPWRTAPAWPDSPPPATLTMMSKVCAWLVSIRGCLQIMIEVWRPKNFSMSLPFTTIWPEPFFRNTRATLDLRRPVPLFHSPIISGSLNFQHFGLLGRVRVLSTGIDLELLDHGVAERPLGQHALDGFFQGTARELGLHVTEVDAGDAARITGVAVIDFVSRFGAGDAQLGCIDDDHEVAGIDVRRVNGLVFAAQTESNFAGYRSEEHTSELQSRQYLVCRLLLEKKKPGLTPRGQARHMRPSSSPATQRPSTMDEQSPQKILVVWSRTAILMFFFFLMMRRPPSSTLFPSPTLFRSGCASFESILGFPTILLGFAPPDGRFH